MGGACRETFDLTNKYGRMNFWRHVVDHRPKLCLSRIPWNLALTDTLMKYVCMVVGHNAYDTTSPESCAPPEWACHRCQRFIKVKK